MSLVGFGQPDDGIIQTCYLVPDIRAAMTLWIDKLKVGPWFLLDHFSGTHPKYRGRDSKADVSLAMSFAGHMNIGSFSPTMPSRRCIANGSISAATDFITGVARRGISIGTWRTIRRRAMILRFSPACRAGAAWPTWTPRRSCPAMWS